MNNNIDIKDSRLSNGLRIVTVRKPGDLMSFSLGFNGGSTEDREDKKGITHFLEHMLFTGTNNRSHDLLNEELEFLGGSVDAFTDIDSVTLNINCLLEEKEKVFDLLSDMVINSTFPQKEVERERNVVLSEYKEGLEDLETVTYDYLYEYAYPKNNLRYSVIGNEETISSFTKEDLEKRYDELIRPERASAVLVSSLDHDEMLDLLSKYFSNWKRDVKCLVNKERPISNKRGRHNINSNSFDMATVCLLYAFPELPKEYETALRIISNRLGESDNSLLFNEVRLKRGLSYDIYSNLEISDQCKTLEIYCATDRKSTKRVERVIKDTIRKLKKGEYSVNDRSLQLMKKILRTSITTLTDDTFSLGSYITGNALEGKDLLKYKEELNSLEKVDEELIDRVLNYVFKNPTVVILNGE